MGWTEPKTSLPQLFSEKHRGKTRGKNHMLQQGRFKLAYRKKIGMVSIIKHQSRNPEKLRRFSKLSWTRPWASWPHWKVGPSSSRRLGWVTSSLPSSVILCDCLNSWFQLGLCCRGCSERQCEWGRRAQCHELTTYKEYFWVELRRTLWSKIARIAVQLHCSQPEVLGTP